ncbi:hypothetical protein ABZV75_01025 [Streptomyces flaveolus]|uniref:hypothetical protein n=1 Tax=Streptomyces flaveolus TaxID=67297 RepID=UPI0033ACE3DD
MFDRASAGGGAVNGDGLRFAVRHGYAEIDRYVLDGERDEWVDLRLSPGGARH